MPRFVSPGDKATIALDVTNLSGAPQTVSVAVTSTGPVKITGSAEPIKLNDKQRQILRFQAEALGFQREGPATREGVVKGRQFMPVKKFFGARMIRILCASPSPALPDFFPGFVQHFFVCGVFPQHKILDDFEQALTLFFLSPFRWKQVRVGRRVVHHLGKDDRPRRRQRPPGPPAVKIAWIPMPNRLLPRAGLVDGLQREGDFD